MGLNEILVTPTDLYNEVFIRSPLFTKGRQEDAEELLSILFEDFGKFLGEFMGKVLMKMKCNLCEFHGDICIPFPVIRLQFPDEMYVAGFEHPSIGMNDLISEQFDFSDQFNGLTCTQCGEGSLRTSGLTRVAAFPNILCFTINRTKWSSESNRSVKSQAKLKFSVDSPGEKSESWGQFKLKGVVEHIGQGNTGGHYVAYAKHDEWLRCSDSTVLAVSEERVTSTTPDILLYEKL